MQPIDHAPSAGSIGIGQTNTEGILDLKSSAGDGLESGTYRVSFSLRNGNGSQGSPGEDKKEAANSVETKELIPHPYSNGQESTVLFEVKRGQNVFEFDILSK